MVEEKKNPIKTYDIKNNPYEIKSMLDSKKNNPSFKLGPITSDKNAMSTKHFKILLYHLVKARNEQLKNSPVAKKSNMTRDLSKKIFDMQKNHKELAEKIADIHQNILGQKLEQITTQNKKEETTPTQKSRKERYDEIHRKIDQKLKTGKIKQNTQISLLKKELLNIELLRKKVINDKTVDKKDIKIIDEKIRQIKEKIKAKTDIP